MTASRNFSLDTILEAKDVCVSEGALTLPREGIRRRDLTAKRADTAKRQLTATPDHGEQQREAVQQ
nr:hypothetical protein [Dyella sp. ASV24]